MPRAKPKNTPPRFSIKPYTLSPELKEELVNLLGYDKGVSEQQARITKAVNRIEHYIGRYHGIMEVDKHLPSNANLTVELKTFVKRGNFSEFAFADLHPWLQYKFDQRGCDLSSAPHDPDNVSIIADDILQSLAGEQRGRRRNQPFRDLIVRLRKTFRDFHTNELHDDARYGGMNAPDTLALMDEVIEGTAQNHRTTTADMAISNKRYRSNDGIGQHHRHRSGSVENLSEAEYNEYEFVTFILQAADIPIPKNLLDLFKDIGRPPAERGEVINRIARRVARRRK